MFGTIMNMMRKKSAKMQFMTVKAARISIPGVLVITTSMRRAMDSFLRLHQEKSHNGEEENSDLSVTRLYGKDMLACEIAEAVIVS